MGVFDKGRLDSLLSNHQKLSTQAVNGKPLDLCLIPVDALGADVRALTFHFSPIVV